jgi:hypothetical protein
MYWSLLLSKIIIKKYYGKKKIYKIILSSCFPYYILKCTSKYLTLDSEKINYPQGNKS